MLSVGVVSVLVVQVHEGALHLWDVLQLLLQRLADVMGHAQTHALRKHDVQLHQEVAAEVERTHGVDVANVLVVVHRHPRQLGQEVRPRRVARQHLDLLCTRKRNMMA